MSTKASIKFALLAYSVYCWVDGSARTRNNLGSGVDVDALGGSEFSTTYEDDGPSRGLTVVWEWIQSRGSAMSEEEQSVLGKMDVITAFLLFNGIQRLSFLPVQTPRPILPVTFPHSKDNGPLSWRMLVLATALLSLVHETQRAAIIYYLRRRRVNLTDQIRKDLANMRIGEVVVRGDNLALPRTADEEEEQECLICSGSAETMSTSSHTIDGDRAFSSLGPLEAFCTIAPQKHLAHRSCFLRWHAAYLQQSHHSLGNAVTLLDDVELTTPSPPPRTLERLFIRTSIILQAAGFSYLTPKLKRTSQTSAASGEDTQPPTLTIHHRTDAAPALLATLRTSAPPCPGCRSPVALRFIDARPPMSVAPPSVPGASSVEPNQPQPSPNCGGRLRLLWKAIALLHRILLSKFWHEWPAIVTGKTLSAYFGSLMSFMAVLVAITKARESRRSTRISP